jgi:hypothetical protein
MEDFTITIDGKEYNGDLIIFGYSYKIVVSIDDIPVTFEPDEERNFRALVPPDQVNKINARLLKSIAEELEVILKAG